MVKHIVMFKLKENTPENLSQVVEALRSMEGKIETLKHIEVGENFKASDRAFDVVLTTHFDNESGLDAYIAHPVHQPVVTLIRSLCEKMGSVDYNFS